MNPISSSHALVEEFCVSDLSIGSQCLGIEGLTRHDSAHPIKPNAVEAFWRQFGAN